MIKVKVDTRKVKNNLSVFDKRFVDSCVEGMSATMAEAEKESKMKAPWTDRTGNARRSIYGSQGELEGNKIKGYHGIGVYYGVYLELCHGGKYRVIEPTMEYEITRLPVWIRWANEKNF
jgi:hypothetical protein